MNKNRYGHFALLLSAFYLIESGTASAQDLVDGPPPPSLDDLFSSSAPALPAPAQQAGDALPVVEDVETRTDEFGTVGNPGMELELGVNEPTAEELKQSIRDDAYDAALTGLFPLQPEQIKKLLEFYDETKKNAESPLHGLPQPTVGVATISLDPGVLPPVVDVAVGHVTTLNILDVTGAPWPVHDVSWAGDFEVVEPLEGGHMIRITPLSEFAYGNLSVRLLTLKTPITFSLRTSRDKVHYRLDARIPEYGPFAQTSLIDGGSQLQAGNTFMTSVLEGRNPGGTERLEVSGADGRTTAYRSGGKMYVRTPLNLLSPGWDSSVSSADGMNVYSLSESPVILLSDEGKFVRATIMEKEDIFDE